MIAADLIRDQLQGLGVEPGMLVQVHCSYSQVAPMEGGPTGLIEAILQVLGPDGTLVMPSMTDDDSNAFDPALTACYSMGIVADTFWRRPGVLRSDSPHAFSAYGPKAALITAPHPITVPHGPDSPVGKVHDLNGYILLLGVGHECNSTVHLAEELQHAAYRVPMYSTIIEHGQARRIHYSEPACCTGRFALLDEPLDAVHLQSRSVVGNAEARLVRSRDVVRIARALLATDPLVFLHGPNTCSECDEARAWLPRSGQNG